MSASGFDVLLLAEMRELKFTRTGRIARRLGVPTPKALRSLKRLERQGLVERNSRYSFEHDYAWSLPSEVRP